MRTLNEFKEDIKNEIENDKTLKDLEKTLVFYLDEIIGGEK